LPRQSTSDHYFPVPVGVSCPDTPSRCPTDCRTSSSAELSLGCPALDSPLPLICLSENDRSIAPAEAQTSEAVHQRGMESKLLTAGNCEDVENPVPSGEIP